MTRAQDGPASPRLSDEELEYYGDLYIRYGIREAGVEFESFLLNPEYYLRKHSRGRWRAGGGDDGRKGFRRYLRRLQATPSQPD